MKLVFSGATHRGRMRPYNQDSIFYSEDLNVGMVADGIGGNKGGEIASSMAISGVRREIMRAGSLSDVEIIPFLNNVIKKVNGQILTRCAHQSEVSQMGTTFECMLLVNDFIYICHVGDSRTYLYSEDKIAQITRDHNIENFVEDGLIKKRELHPKYDPKALTCALGFSFDSKVDFYKKKAKPGELFLLATDGLTDLVDQNDIHKILSRHDTDFDDLSEQLVAEANRCGGRDNITVVLGKVIDD